MSGNFIFRLILTWATLFFEDSFSEPLDRLLQRQSRSPSLPNDDSLLYFQSNSDKHPIHWSATPLASAQGSPSGRIAITVHTQPPPTLFGSDQRGTIPQNTIPPSHIEKKKRKNRPNHHKGGRKKPRRHFHNRRPKWPHFYHGCQVANAPSSYCSYIMRALMSGHAPFCPNHPFLVYVLPVPQNLIPSIDSTTNISPSAKTTTIQEVTSQPSSTTQLTSTMAMEDTTAVTTETSVTTVGIVTTETEEEDLDSLITTTLVPDLEGYCPLPRRPKNGLVVCNNDRAVAPEIQNGNDSLLVESRPTNNYYASGSVCRLFCLIGHDVPESMMDETTIVCQEGLWNQTMDVDCLATHCPTPPRIENTVVSCYSDPAEGLKLNISATYFRKNSFCRYQCPMGFERFDIPDDDVLILCEAPEWTQPIVGPLCIEKIIISPILNCHGQTVQLIGPDSFDISSLVEAKSGDVSSKSLTVNCTNNLDGTKRLDSEGFYQVFCETMDPEFNAISNCSFSLEVQAGCNPPPDHPPNGYKHCEISESVSDVTNKMAVSTKDSFFHRYPVNSICDYDCDEGFLVLNSQQHLQETIICTENRTWSSLSTPNCVPRVEPVPIVPCQDQTILVQELDEIPIHLPRFLSGDNSSRDVLITCVDQTSRVLTNESSFPDDWGLNVVICEALDEEMQTKARCNFSVQVDAVLVPTTTTMLPSTDTTEVEIDTDEPEVTTGPSTTAEEDLSTETITTETDSIETMATTEMILSTTIEPNREILSYVVECPSLLSPANGQLTCDLTDGQCTLICRENYSLPSLAGKPRTSLVLICLKNTGFWDFQEDNDSSIQLPDCLAKLPETSLEAPLAFHLRLLSPGNECSENLLPVDLLNATQSFLIAQNEEICALIQCDQWRAECEQNGDQFELKITWIIRASYAPADYSDDDLDLDAESNIDNLRNKVKVLLNSATTSDTDSALAFRELLESYEAEIKPESYRQQFFNLVCDENGYVVESLTSLCLECPSGTFEMEGKTCQPCVAGSYQANTGQSSCVACPLNRPLTTSAGSKTSHECKEM